MARQKHAIIVGSGTSGTILAYRLLQRGWNVTLIDPAIEVHRPKSDPTWQAYFQLNPLEDIWTVEACKSKYVPHIGSSSQKCLQGRSVQYPCGTGVGGNSNINAMMFDVGHPSIYDRNWPSDWDSVTINRYAGVVDTILKPFSQRTAGNMLRLIGGIAEAAGDQKSAVVYNYPSTMEPNGKRRLRLVKIFEQLPRKAYDRLFLLKGSVVRLSILDGVVNGIILSDGQTLPVDSGTEVILSSGSIITPQIVYNSLANASISSKDKKEQEELFKLQELVGVQLLDHFTLPYVGFGNWYGKWKVSGELQRSPDFPLNGIHGWIFLDERGNFHPANAKTPPSCQLIFVDGSILTGLIDTIIPQYESSSLWWELGRYFLVSVLKYILHLAFVRWLCSFVFGVLICSIQPKSTGRCSFLKMPNEHKEEKTFDAASAEEVYTIKLDPNFLGDGDDVRALHAAYLRARQIIHDARSNGTISFWELVPGFLFRSGISITSFETFASWFGTSYFHISGTCPMDRYENGQLVKEGVLSGNLRVKHTKNLSVADASVFPAIPSFPTAKLSMIVGAKAADIISPIESNKKGSIQK